jgi:hypothetical protein
MGNMHLSSEAEAYFERKGCVVLFEADTRGGPDVQPIARQEDRALSRDLLKERPW